MTFSSISNKTFSIAICLIFFVFQNTNLIAQEDTTQKKITFYNDDGKEVSKEQLVEDDTKNLIKIDPITIPITGEIGLLYERRLAKNIGLELGAGPTIYIAQGHWNGEIHASGIKTKVGYFAKTQIKFYLRDAGSYYGEGFYIAPGIRFRMIRFQQELGGSLSNNLSSIMATDISLFGGWGYRNRRRFISDSYIGVGLKHYKTDHFSYDSGNYVPTELSGFAFMISFGAKFGLGF